MKAIERVAVLGAGVMGSGIAAHLANAGMRVLLLDVVPAEPNDAERKAGLTTSSPAVRNRLAAAGVEAAKKTRAFYLPAYASNVEIGNLDDDVARLRECDWVIEAVVEDLEVKRKLFAEKVAPNLKEGAVLSSNTSGLSVEAMAAVLPPAVRQRFLVVHFFNPPRHMRLVEVVACRRTSPEVLEGMTSLLRRRLGKGVVRGKDTPNFVANRIGVYSMCNGFRHMADLGMTVEEVDAVAGPATARPRSALFRLADLVGLDTLFHIAKHTRDLLPKDKDRDEFGVAPAMERMVAKGLKGNKAKQGFYRKERGADGAEHALVYDLAAEQYVAAASPRFASVEATKGIEDPGKRIAAVLAGTDKAAEFAWRNLRDTLLYAFKRIPEIADDVVSVDDAMRWGFSWELGPFEMLDAIGVRAFVERAKRDGVKVPPALARIDRFYAEKGGKRRCRSLSKKGDWRDVPRAPERIDLGEVRRRGGVVEESDVASILDLGDGVLCLEFHSKMNAIDAGVLAMVERASARAASEAVGLVVANHGKVFSAGANLAWIAGAIRERRFDDIDALVRLSHRALMAVKCAPVPVVAAPHGMALGGGAEICLHCAGLAPHAELSMGLVEAGVGLIPGGGGTKELALRAIRDAAAYDADVTPFVTRNFRLISMARTSGSAAELREMGMLRDGDAVTLDLDALVFRAKQRVLALSSGYRPVAPAADLKAPGQAVAAALTSSLWNLRMGAFISAHDEKVGRAVAGVITGGDVPSGTPITEAWLMELEREAFLSLCGEPLTLARIEHMLKTGKPLRN
ncbi:MAG: 3-hydroxyacyl-CoA dehydrogenase/enoyl-CoA hydratase family protein [Anaeromyxobacteraceae bacterium]